MNILNDLKNAKIIKGFKVIESRLISLKGMVIITKNLGAVIVVNNTLADDLKTALAEDQIAKITKDYPEDSYTF